MSNSHQQQSIASPIRATRSNQTEPRNSLDRQQRTYQPTTATKSKESASSTSSSLKKALAAFGLGKSTSSVDRTQRNEGLESTGTKMGRVDQVKMQGRRVMRYVKRKLNSKSPQEELPKTWEEYGKAYAAHEIDMDDPPLPPARNDDNSTEPTPFEQRVYVAPRPVNEVARQNVVNRLDLFGTRSRAAQSPQIQSVLAPSIPSVSNASTNSLPLSPTMSSSAQTAARRGSTAASIVSTAPSTILDDGIDAGGAEAEPSSSLENHPVFRSIVSRCREIFQTKVGLLTVLDDEQQLFLAAGGMPEGVDKLPRDVTFCSHAILGEDKGMVVLNTQEDWRFTNNLPSTALGARFYAGVPLYAKTAGHANAPSVAIGTLCVADDKPREEFTEAHRRVLRDLATQASNAIEVWANQRMAIKLARLHGALPNASLPDLPRLVNTPSEPPLLTPPPSAGLPTNRNMSTTSLPARPKTAPAPTPPLTPLPASPPQSVHRFEPLQSTSHSRQASDASTASTRPPPRRPSTALAFAVTTEDPVSLVPRDLQKMFDTATKMLAKHLSLDLVYLAAIDLSKSTLRIISARGLPSPPPSFDPSLHVRALRAAEGGLIYKNPRFIPLPPSPSLGSSSANSGSYASGILIPVLEVRRCGYVLCGYTSNHEREFVQRDLSYMVKFAEQLEGGVTRLGKTNPSPMMATTTMGGGSGGMDMVRSSSMNSIDSTNSNSSLRLNSAQAGRFDRY